MTTKTKQRYKGKRLQVLERAPIETTPELKLTRKQVEMIKAIAQYQALLEPQILRLLFPSPGSKSYCQALLKALFQHHYLLRQRLPYEDEGYGRPLIYWLDQRGVEVMAGLDEEERQFIEWDASEWRPEERDLAISSHPHLIEQNEVGIAFELAARALSMPLVKFLNEKTLRSAHMQPSEMVTIAGPQGGRKRVSVIADFYFHLWTEVKDLRHLVELDRSTRTGRYSKWGERDWFRKTQAYVEYTTGREKKYKRRYGSDQGRILTVVVAGEKRVQTLLRVTKEAGGKNKFWFTTYQELMSLTPPEIFVAPIWLIATKEEEGRQALLKPEWLPVQAKLVTPTRRKTALKTCPGRCE